jgi:hypothetical protein
VSTCAHRVLDGRVRFCVASMNMSARRSFFRIYISGGETDHEREHHADSDGCGAVPRVQRRGYGGSSDHRKLALPMPAYVGRSPGTFVHEAFTILDVAH